MIVNLYLVIQRLYSLYNVCLVTKTSHLLQKFIIFPYFHNNKYNTNMAGSDDESMFEGLQTSLLDIIEDRNKTLNKVS